MNSTSVSRRLAGVALTALAALALSACATGSGAAPASASTREFTTDTGTVTIPKKIDRVVSVDFYTPAALLDLGVKPVGVVNTYFEKESRGIPDTYREQVQKSDAISIGEYYELNVEAVAQAKPDVIVATDDFLPLDDPMRAQLEKIAPIVTFSARDSLSWKTRADGMADLMGRTEQLATVKKTYEDRLAEVKQAHPSFLDNETMAVFVPTEDTWGTYASTHFTGGVWSDVGARYRDQQPDEINEAKFPNWFSFEALDRLNNATVLFSQIPITDIVPALTDSVLWKNLPAVKDGMVFENIPYSPTGSYGWGTINLNDIDPLLTRVETARAEVK
ncbi:ABC transporter substrate-binding protein [Mycetocola tolaasinivorans]|uniref:ABC transporter substrate-binding protein n=1 Tax=Mycetocola tolaasinivorans TaxID=76635 RepID=A0A3L7AB32_9MICO|nr:ABC transporter substrate-binding protein [Mycetocola tolaasinivorans]RLP77533.1 ABC transporter substrate-binding protein [Mycetocola tolaasinivorans]